MCEFYNKQFKTDFRSVMPTNIYGLNDKYHENSHVIPAMIMKFHKAKINKKILFEFGDQKVERIYFLDDMVICLRILFKPKNMYYKFLKENMFLKYWLRTRIKC